MKILFKQFRFFFAIVFSIMACEYTLEPGSDLNDILFLEDTFMEAKQLYHSADPGDLDSAVEKFKLVLKNGLGELL